MQLISADSHVLEPADLWTRRIERRFREQAPRVVHEVGGRTRDLFVCENLRPVAVGSLALAGLEAREYPRRMSGGHENARPSAWDPAAPRRGR